MITYFFMVVTAQGGDAAANSGMASALFILYFSNLLSPLPFFIFKYFHQLLSVVFMIRSMGG